MRVRCELTCPSFSSFRLLGSLSRSGVRLRNFSDGDTDLLSLSSVRAIGLRSSGVSAAALCCCRSDGFRSACACAWTAAAAAGCGGGARWGGTPAAAAAAAAPANPNSPAGGRPPTTAPCGSCCAWICCWNNRQCTRLPFPSSFPSQIFALIMNNSFHDFLQ